MCRCKVTGPNVELYFSLNGYKCNLHFWHAQNEFPFFVHTCIDIQFERSRVQQYDPFRHWFHHGLYDVGLHVPGNILLHSLSLYCFYCTWNVPFGILERTTFHCPDQDIFLCTTICKFPLQCFWSTAQFYFRSPVSPPKKTNKQLRQINKRTERMLKFWQVLSTGCKNLSAWPIYFWRRGESKIPPS